MFLKKLLLFPLLLTGFAVYAQQADKYTESYYYNNNGNKFYGQLDEDDSDKHLGVQLYIECKANKNSDKVKIPLTEISSFVIEQDSFTVSKQEICFYRVCIDNNPMKLYAATHYQYYNGPYSTSRVKVTRYYYGPNPEMVVPFSLKNDEALSEVLADKPDMVKKIKDKKLRFENIEDLIFYYTTGKLPVKPKKFKKGAH